MPTLLEKAKSVAVRLVPASKEEITNEHIDLILAYFNGEITVRQAAFALEQKNPGNFTAWLGKAVKILYRQGKIQIIK